ncbi:MAG: thiamine pyrophosphate-dependent enzyme [Chloroflexota bacterium]
MKRMEAMQIIADRFPQEPIIANCGATSRELAAIERSDRHFYILDSMGMASSVGLGLALALEETAVNHVIVLEGDGALLMNLSSLASIAYHRPKKLLLVVLDNAAYASTGGQPTYTTQLDLAQLAQGANLTTYVAANGQELRSCLDKAEAAAAPVFLHVKIEAGNSPNIPYLLEDPAIISHRFSNWLAKRLTI